MRVKDIATVAQGPKIRLGQIGKTCRFGATPVTESDPTARPDPCVERVDKKGKPTVIQREDGKLIDNNDAIEGIVLLHKGDNSDATSKPSTRKSRSSTTTSFPPALRSFPSSIAATCSGYTTQTVLHNLTEGIILVVIILFLFLGNVRGALIVALTMPFALLFASICLDLRNIPANLLSLGALDFGMVVDGAVVMVENIVRHLSHGRRRTNYDAADPRGCARGPAPRLLCTRHNHHRVLAYLYAAGSGRPPLQADGLDGSFALIGALIFSMLLAPVLASLFFPNGSQRVGKPGDDAGSPTTTALPPSGLSNIVRHAHVSRDWRSSCRSSSFSAASSAPNSYPISTKAPSGSVAPSRPAPAPPKASRHEQGAHQPRRIPRGHPGCQPDRPPRRRHRHHRLLQHRVLRRPQAKEEWRPVFKKNKDELIAAMDRELDKTPGVLWNFSQPISDNVEEAVSGVKGELAIKIYGDDLKTLEEKGNQIVSVMSNIRGVQDLGLFRVIGQPNLNYTVDREAAARYGINVADVQDAIETAVGGNAVTQVLRAKLTTT